MHVESDQDKQLRLGVQRQSTLIGNQALRKSVAKLRDGLLPHQSKRELQRRQKQLIRERPHKYSTSYVCDVCGYSKEQHVDAPRPCKEVL